MVDIFRDIRAANALWLPGERVRPVRDRALC
jgi:hypothetical protein